jgi:hypothetical protein
LNVPTLIPFSTDGKKRCGKCKSYLDPSEFYKKAINPSGLSCYCKKCTLAGQHLRYVTHPREWKGRVLKNQYGITMAQYEALSRAQGHKCGICGTAEASIHRAGTKRELSVDHDHDTGEVRGLLCNRCNRGIGYFGDSVGGLLKAVAYLRQHRGIKPDFTPLPRAAKRTHCRRGHEFTPENTGLYAGKRSCRACGRLRQNTSRAIARLIRVG